MVKPEKWRYGVVLDAGSSGTRIHIYRWLRNSLARLDPEIVHHLPELETKDKWTEKIHPGISTFGETPQLVGPDHLEHLVKHALNYVPTELVPDTPIFLLATAGVRLLPPLQRKNLLSSVCSYLQAHTKFWIPDCDQHVQVISGQTEGLYGWIAANYLLGGFDTPESHNHGKNHHTYGFLDMGGASAQIAFAPNATEAEKHANDLTLLRLRTAAGETQEYRVFVTTWLGFGVNEARRRYLEQLKDSYSFSGGSDFLELPDPCLPTHLTMTLDGQVIPVSQKNRLATERHLLGTGDFNECLRRTLPLLEKDRPCPDPPCLINGIHVPAIDFDVNHFIGISEYWHTTHEIFEYAHDDKAFDFNTYQTRVKEFCEQDWSAIQEDIGDRVYGKKIDEQTAYEVCFKASWLISMLHDGIGIPRVGLENTTSPIGLNGTKEVLDAAKEKGYLEAFQAVKDIKSTEVSWTLGKMVLYAAADVPVSNLALPVGFGSNIVGGGIPPDFQFPGGGRLQGVDPNDDNIYTNDGDDSTFSDSLFRSDAPHRLPGFILFLLIIIIVVFYLCGRDRRSKIYRSIFGGNSKDGFYKPSPSFSNRQRSNPLISRLNRLFGRGGFGSSTGPNYSAVSDRDLEGGDNIQDNALSIPHPGDFELGSISRLHSNTTNQEDDEDSYSENSSTYAVRKSTRSRSRLDHQTTRSRSQSYSKTDKPRSTTQGRSARHSSPMFHFRTSPTSTIHGKPSVETLSGDIFRLDSSNNNNNDTTNRPGSSSSNLASIAGIAAANASGRLTPDIMDRKGLVVRSDSRVSLTASFSDAFAGNGLYTSKLAAGQRSKSRAGSPDRFIRD